MAKKALINREAKRVALAKKYAAKRGWKFVIFTQDTLSNLGIGITKSPAKKKTR